MAQQEGPGAGEENDGLHRPLTLSEELSEVVGDGPMGRADVVSGMWDYIKRNDLQDGQEIRADDKLKAVRSGQAAMATNLSSMLHPVSNPHQLPQEFRRHTICRCIA